MAIGKRHVITAPAQQEPIEVDDRLKLIQSASAIGIT
jgi:hypothetical protein